MLLPLNVLPSQVFEGPGFGPGLPPISIPMSMLVSPPGPGIGLGPGPGIGLGPGPGIGLGPGPGIGLGPGPGIGLGPGPGS